MKSLEHLKALRFYFELLYLSHKTCLKGMASFVNARSTAMVKSGPSAIHLITFYCCCCCCCFELFCFVLFCCRRRRQLGSCVKIEVAILGSTSLTVLMKIDSRPTNTQIRHLTYYGLCGRIMASVDVLWPHYGLCGRIMASL